jgi:hypothetical protein
VPILPPNIHEEAQLRKYVSFSKDHNQYPPTNRSKAMSVPISTRRFISAANASGFSLVGLIARGTKMIGVVSLVLIHEAVLR